MADEKLPRERINEILQHQPPTLASPLKEGANIYEDGHFIAAFQAVQLKKIRILDHEITIGDHLRLCGEKNGNKKTYRRVFHLDTDVRPIEDIALGYLVTQIAKALPLDTLDMKEGHTERRVREYSERYRSGSSETHEPLYKFMTGTYESETGGVRTINVGGMIGAEIIPIADRFTPLWISYIRSIAEVHPLALSPGGFVSGKRMDRLPIIPSYTEWAKKQQIEFTRGLKAELRLLGYRATLRRFQKENPRSRD